MPNEGPRTLHGGKSNARDASEPPDVVEAELTRRVRRGTDAFAFDALLNGVARGPALEPPPPEATSSHAPVVGYEPCMPEQQIAAASRPPDLAEPLGSALPGLTANRRWIGALVLVAALAGTAASLLVQMVLPRHRGILPEATPAARTLNPLVMRGLPDPQLTPGDLGPSTGSIPPDIRQAVLVSYGISPDDPQFVLCALIPKSLGGSERSSNLFPTTRWFANLKARVDAALTAQVLSGGITAGDAMTQLKTNWIKAAHSNYVRNYGRSDASKAKAEEDRLAW